MAGTYTSSRIDDLPSIWGGMCKLVRSGLGLSAFGANVLDIGPTTRRPTTRSPRPARRSSTSCCTARPRCSSAPPGEEESVELVPEVVARVAPEARRLFRTGPEGARLLIIGGAPGQVYEPQDWSSAG